MCIASTFALTWMMNGSGWLQSICSNFPKEVRPLGTALRWMRCVEQNDKPLLESIRQMLREEIGGARISPSIPVVQTVNTELTEEQKEENRRNVLQDLDELFG